MLRNTGWLGGRAVRTACGHDKPTPGGGDAPPPLPPHKSPCPGKGGARFASGGSRRILGSAPARHAVVVTARASGKGKGGKEGKVDAFLPPREERDYAASSSEPWGIGSGRGVPRAPPAEGGGNRGQTVSRLPEPGKQAGHPARARERDYESSRGPGL